MTGGVSAADRFPAALGAEHHSGCAPGHVWLLTRHRRTLWGRWCRSCPSLVPARRSNLPSAPGWDR